MNKQIIKYKKNYQINKYFKKSINSLKFDIKKE